MKAVVSLAFLAFAQAALLEVPEVRYANPEPYLFADFPISPMQVRSMFYKYGLEKPAFDNEFLAFSKSLGLEEPLLALKLRSIYDEPALMFFKDPLGDVISYFADSGIHYRALSPEVREVFSDLLSSAEFFAVAHNPERILEAPEQNMLSGRFFQPLKDIALSRFLSLKPEPEHYALGRSIVFRRPEISSIFPQLRYFPARYDIDEMPFAYKVPVALKYDYPSLIKSDTYKPYAYDKLEYPWEAAFRLAKAAYPWTTKSYPLVDAKYPVPYAPSYYKYDLPYSPLYAKYEMPFTKYEKPYSKYELPYAKFDIPYAKYELPYAKYELPYAKYELPHAKYELPYAKYELPYAKYELPYAKYELPYAKYELPYAKNELPYPRFELLPAHSAVRVKSESPLKKDYIIVPEDYNTTPYLKSPYIKPISAEKVQAKFPVEKIVTIKYAKPQTPEPIIEKELVFPEQAKPRPVETPLLRDAQVGLRNSYTPTPIEYIRQPEEERMLNVLLTQKYGENAFPIVRDPFLEEIPVYL